VSRFLDRVWRATQQAHSKDQDLERERRRHRLIAHVGERYAELSYNTAIAFLMEFSHALANEAAAGTARRVDAETLLQLLAPLAPHLTEELWERLGHRQSIHDSGWPAHDPALVAAQQVTVVVQVNGKPRDQMQVDAGLDRAELERRARELPKIAALLEGQEVRKVVVVPDRRRPGGLDRPLRDAPRPDRPRPRGAVVGGDRRGEPRRLHRRRPALPAGAAAGGAAPAVDALPRPRPPPLQGGPAPGPGAGADRRARARRRPRPLRPGDPRGGHRAHPARVAHRP